MNPNLILYNAKIYTVDPKRPFAEAVACHNGRFTAIGTNADIKALAGDETEMIDVQGKLVLPGLTDSHVHFRSHAIYRQWVNLFGINDFDEAMALIKTAVSRAKPGEWVQGSGWGAEQWHTKPHRRILDAIAPDNPVALGQMDMHSWWVNSRALEIGKITADTADLPESKIERDADGTPSGILREWNAISLVKSQIPLASEAEELAWMREAIAEAHQLGLTAVHDQRVENEGDVSLRRFQKLNHDGDLKLRIHHNIAAGYLAEAAQLGLQPGFGDDRLWLGHVKSFSDGAMGSRTALMIAPYDDEPENTGIAVTPAAELMELAAAAHAANFPLSIHAIGDLAVRNVLDAMESIPRRTDGMPHRIEHSQIMHPDDLSRLAAHGISTAVQPIHLETDWRIADVAWGDRARYTYAFRSLLDLGTVVAFGSDAPVAPINPMWGIAAAITRQSLDHKPEGGWYPQEKVTMAEAIYAYTMAPAIIADKQAVQGSITVGKWADIIVMNDDLFEMEETAVADATIAMTVFAGELVYESKKFAE